MKKGSMWDVIGDNVFFRELNPQNPDLVPIDVVLYRLNLDHVPRKKDPEYPQVISCYLNLLGDFDRVLFLGDTLLNDRTFAKNLIALGEYEVVAVITRQNEDEFELKEEDGILFSNRWSFIRELPDFLKKRGFEIDEKTAVILDIDKTFIGARGRNHQSIDLARAEAVYRLFKETRNELEFEEFMKIYNKLNSPEFYSLTSDNQDIVAFLTILAASNEIEFEMKDIESVAKYAVEKARNERIREFASEIYENLKARKATLFPTFRRMEFLTTIEFMDRFDDAPPERLLKEEILITGEIYDTFNYTLATVIALTDKPEASSLPPEGSSLPPVHKKTAKIWGE